VLEQVRPSKRMGFNAPVSSCAVKRRSILLSMHTFLMLNISAIMSIGDRVTMAIPRPMIVITEGRPAHLGYLGMHLLNRSLTRPGVPHRPPLPRIIFPGPIGRTIFRWCTALHQTQNTHAAIPNHNNWPGPD
jgi:hypothetical protein